jgi:hypothetical protein
MKGKLHIYYDKEGDFLEFTAGKPTKGYLKDVGHDVFERIDEKTGEVRGLAIFNFKKRTAKLKPIDVSLPVKIKLTS